MRQWTDAHHLGPLTGPASRVRSAPPAGLPRASPTASAASSPTGGSSSGTRLPSERTLTTELGLSRTTVGAALDALRDEGFVATRRGSGSVVCLPTGPVGARAVAGRPHPHRRPARRHRPHVCRPPGRRRGHRGLRAGPRRAAALPRDRRLRPARAPRDHGPPWPPGSRRRGLSTSPDQVVITSGAHGGLSAVLRSQLEIGDRVLVESPTYPNAIVGVRRSAYRAVAAQLTATGWDVDAIEVGPASERRPGGIPHPRPPEPDRARHGRRRRDRRWAAVLARANVVPVIDETFVELGLDETGRSRPSRRRSPASSPAAHTLGSAGKTWWGGLRVGWVRAPRGWRRGRHRGPPQPRPRHGDPRAARRHRPAAPGRGPADRAPTRGALPARRPRHGPAPARARLALRRCPPGGLNLWCELPEARGDELARVAESAGVRLARGGQFGVEGGFTRWVRVPFCVAPDEADEVGRRLATAWQLALGERPTTREVTPLIA